jgi:DNA polymerase, archaea type
VKHKDSALIPEGRILIDTAKSFVYSESGLKGVLMAARLTGLSPNLTSRFTPGTLISSYEVFEALRRGLAVPFRKRDAEGLRNISELKVCDKGGMIFQPEPGVYEQVHQIDFTSLPVDHREIQSLTRNHRSPRDEGLSEHCDIIIA